MQLIVDNEHLGTTEVQWRNSSYLNQLTSLELTWPQRVVLLAPHPDDEVLGTGGFIQHALSQGTSLMLLAVTDGEQSHPHASSSLIHQLSYLRPRETRVALGRLGWHEPVIHRLCIPDGEVSQHVLSLQDELTRLLRPGDLCVAPWRFDGHPDHDACGEAALSASRNAGATYLAYLVWTWHWATPEDRSIPWQSFRKLRLSRHEQARKRWATSAFETQISRYAPPPFDSPVLPESIVRRFWRPFEVFVLETESL